MPTFRSFPILLLLAAVLASGACAGEQSTPEPVAQAGFDNPDLGLRVASVPPPFTLLDNGTQAITFASSEGGDVELTVGPETDSGILLIDEVRARQQAFDALAEGTFHGQLEIQGPHGPAYTARGSYAGDGDGRLEETWIYSLHPGAYRLLNLRYRYPQAEDSQERMLQLMELFGEVEPSAGAEG